MVLSRLAATPGARLAAAVVASRLVVIAAATLAETVVPRNPALTSGADGPLIRSLTSWDGWWYLGIARSGYHAEPLVDGYRDLAFLPLYPVLVRILSAPWPELAGVVAVVLSNVAFVAAILLLARLGLAVLRDGRAERAAILLAISPFSAVFSMAYAESLFLALVLGAFLAAERERRPLAGILLALATLTRLQGALLAIPLALLLVRRDRGVRPATAWLLAGPAAAALFLAWASAVGGPAGGYAAALGAWGRSGAGTQPAGGSLGSAITLGGDIYLVVLLGILLGGVFLLVHLRPDRIPAPYALIPPLALASVLGSGLIESVGRYLTVAFPYAWVLAGRRSAVARIAIPGGSLVACAAVSVAIFGGWFVP